MKKGKWQILQIFFPLVRSCFIPFSSNTWFMIALRIAVCFTLNAGCPDRHRDPFLCPCRRSEIRGGGEEDLEFNIIAKDSRKFSARKDLKSFAFLQFLALFVFVFVSSYKVQSLISFKKKK